jgi:hypothetical protein
MKIMKKVMTLTALGILSLTGLTFAQMPPPPGVPMRNDSHRPVDQISGGLGVTTDQFRACFNNVTPAQKGSLPDVNQKHANKQVLLSCLQKSNPSITNDSLDAVMNRYRPGGRAAQ